MEGLIRYDIIFSVTALLKMTLIEEKLKGKTLWRNIVYCATKLKSICVYLINMHFLRQKTRRSNLQN